MKTRARLARLRSLRLVRAAEREWTPPEPRPRVVAVAPRNVPYASAIDPQYPVFGTPTTASVRDNFAAAKLEIEALQIEKLDLSGGTMSGPIVFAIGQRVDGGNF